MSKESKFQIFLQESESIIALHETVFDLIENTEINEEVLLKTDFESVRTTIEEMQSLVTTFYDENDDFCIDEDFVELSIELYQNAKYSIEALEEIITDTEVLQTFETLRNTVDEIRNLCILSTNESSTK